MKKHRPDDCPSKPKHFDYHGVKRDGEPIRYCDNCEGNGPKWGYLLMKHMGCVTDMEFSRALIEQFPNRKPGSHDSAMRKKTSQKYRDILELATKACKNKARRCQDVPLADINNPRWSLARVNHGCPIKGFDNNGHIVLGDI